MKTRPFLSTLLASLCLLTACGPEEQPLPDRAPTPSLPQTPSQPAAFEVRGKVIDKNGHPVPGVAIVLGDSPPANTDASGRFIFTNVKTPYEVVIVDAASRSAVVYKNLSAADLTLLHVGANPQTVHSATLHGTISSATMPKASGSTGFVAFASPSTNPWSWIYDDSSYWIGAPELAWSGSESVSGHLLAVEVQFDAAGRIPTAYTGYAHKSRTLFSGGSFSESFGLLAVAQKSISGTVSAPANYTLSTRGYDLMIDGSRAIGFAEPVATNGFVYVTPSAPDLSLSVYAIATRPGRGFVYGQRSGLAPDAANVKLQLPAPSEAILPADGATGVDGSMRFSWTSMAGGVHVAHFVSQDPNLPRIYVVTNDAFTTLPDLAAYGLRLPSNATYQWSVESIAPLASVDEAAQDGFKMFRTAYAKTESFYGYTDARSFIPR